MTPPRIISRAERRARLGRRHRLAAPAPDVTALAGDLVGLHSSDPVTVVLAARARIDGFTVADLEEALYDRRSVVRMLGMRRTLFVAPVDLAGVIDAACTRALGPPQRRLLERMLEEQGVAEDPATWVDDVCAAALTELARRGEATATELRKAIPQFHETLVFGEGKKWGGAVGVSTRILFLLATEGTIVRGRPRGSWLSSQYRWAMTRDWIDGGLPAIEESAAEVDLVLRWLRTFGPGALEDLKWWTGWGVRRTRAVLERSGAVEVEMDGVTGYVAPGDLESESPAEPWAALLPSLDPTVMGWKIRDWYLGEHAAALFDRNGNAGPTVWWDGRVVGGWAQRGDGEIALRLLEDVGSAAEKAIGGQAARLRVWLGDTRITPRFRTPLEQDLTT